MVTLDEIAERLRIPAGTLRYWRHQGRGPRTFRVGRRVMAYESDVEVWLKEQYDADPRATA
ncbi:MAG: helix-turn-helix transcriptional regulator [Jatrophihabitans sp.]